MKILYSIYYITGYAAPVSMVIFLILLFTGSLATALALVAVLLAPETMFFAYWLPRFYESIEYGLEEDHCFTRYGVWWRVCKRVPYNLIAEVRLRQGPLQRRLGLANLDIYSPARGTAFPELTFFQLAEEEALKIYEELRRRAGILTTRERKVIEEEILRELREIRHLLERIAEAGAGSD